MDAVTAVSHRVEVQREFSGAGVSYVGASREQQQRGIPIRREG